MQTAELAIVISDDDESGTEDASRPSSSRRGAKVGATSRQTSVGRTGGSPRTSTRNRRRSLGVRLLPFSPSTSQQSRGRASPGQVVDLTKVPDDEVLFVSGPTPKRRRSLNLVGPKPGAIDTQLPESSSRASPPRPAPKCGICFEGMEEKMACGPCGHVFCESCLRAAVKSQKKCPTCRRSVQARQIHKVYINQE